MADTFALSANKRENGKKSARNERNKNRVPGIVYGHGVESISLSVSYSDILRTYRKAGTASLIDLDIEGKKMPVLIHELDIHPVRDEIRHIDFYAVNLKEKTTVSVPFVFVGESPAVKTHGGTFVKEHDSISLRCLPADIPHDIQIDITGLENIHDHISIAQLGLDKEKFELMGLDEETVVCSIMGRSASSEDAPSETPEAEGEEGAEGEAAEGEDAKDE